MFHDNAVLFAAVSV